MPKRNIIEDSDDEGDIESPVKEANLGDGHVVDETHDVVQLEPVRLKLNDVYDGAGPQERWTEEIAAARRISMSQPDPPSITTPSNAKPRKKAKTLPDLDMTEVSPDSLASSKATKSFNSNDIFEFQAEDGNDEIGPRKKRRRMQSQLQDEVLQEPLVPPRHTVIGNDEMNSSSTIPTIADTSPFQVTSMSSFVHERQHELQQEDQNTARSLAEIPPDSFEDELAAEYPPSNVKAIARPMVLVQEQGHSNETIGAIQTEESDYLEQKQARSKGPAGSRRDDHDSPDELGSDDQEIGLPKDQYQPRPSRSRGRTRTREDDLVVPVDFSKRPEAVAKTRKKSKHTKGVNTVDSEAKVEELVIEEAEKLEIAVNATSTLEDTKEDQKQSKVEENSITEAASVEIAAKPAKMQRGRPKKKTESFVRNDDAIKPDTTEATSVVEAAKEVAKPTKKAGKSKKSSSIVDEDSEPDERIDVKEGDPVENAGAQPQPQALQELDVNSSPKKRGRPPKTQEEEVPKPQTPQKMPGAVSPKGPGKHSPINTTSAVKYRVGLSKRARIEPLLRIVRK